jgi:hypothetical protein
MIAEIPFALSRKIDIFGSSSQEESSNQKNLL